MDIVAKRKVKGRVPFDLTLKLRTEADVHQLNDMLRAVPDLRQEVLSKVEKITRKAA